MNKVEIKKEIVLNVAQDIFAQYGLTKTMIDDIAKAAGVGKSSIYYYFKNKEDIFRAVIETQVQKVQEKIRASINAAPTPQEKLKAFVISRMKSFREVAHIYNHVFKDEYLKHYEYIQKIRKDYDQMELDLVASILSEGINSGVFKIQDPSLASFVIMVGIKGLEYEWATSTDIQKMEQDTEKLFEILFHGIMK
ncbi:MAG: TetR/AcrR family transcriptional regulator [Candidatus Latescibacteria bacterium]|nr:TetR/AcrR family transcriptional regulator [Candidatus Latescibacterota bacterium]